ncbi:DUF262 domain-containing protein [Luteibacter pinisoli]|uniref:DUF262 domain-containing protein n=1 Tax=Luteibacter pinisoli TaxID=2589080 RepID=A0A4Y5Z016_9GAMM|nr:DUF262 domain-containing protein [Luteibacter pinisoli]QDE38025.1 DUF262 domain-containing protein [Luteibacter pinisoli]
MASKKIFSQDQETLADALFPSEPEEELEEAILSIPPERRVLRTEQYDFSVSTLVAMMDKKEVTVPNFQRRYVWSDRQASRLVESLIIQCPIPVIYLNQERDETFSVIDGNQRLNSLKRFLADEFALTGMTSYPELSGLYCSQLDKRIFRHVNNRVLRCTVILKETHPQVKFDVFERLNSGAVALTRQELRHGLYYGPLLKAASSVAKELQLQAHFGGRKDKRMKAEELVIRFWALVSGIGAYEKPLATFISSYAENNRNVADDKIEELVDTIRRAHARAVELFGASSFAYAKDGRARFNAAVFDAQMISCSRLTEARYIELGKRKAKVRAAFDALQNDNDFSRSVTLATSDKAALQGRIHKVSALLKSL